MASVTSLLKDVRFLTSCPGFSSLPADTGAEAAFAGRSNAGKSSVLNCLTNRKSLAKTSSTPGKTRHINLFGLGGGSDMRFADLPGYGFAKTGVKEQERWGRELTLYVTERVSLKGVVVVMDIRHPLTDTDRQMLILCRTGGKPVHVLLNKSDKLSSNKKAAAKKRVEKDLAFLAPGATLSTFSALKGDGLAEIREILETWLG